MRYARPKPYQCNTAYNLTTTVTHQSISDAFVRSRHVWSLSLQVQLYAHSFKVEPATITQALAQHSERPYQCTNYHGHHTSNIRHMYDPLVGAYLSNKAAEHAQFAP